MELFSCFRGERDRSLEIFPGDRTLESGRLLERVFETALLSAPSHVSGIGGRPMAVKGESSSGRVGSFEPIGSLDLSRKGVVDP